MGGKEEREVMMVEKKDRRTIKGIGKWEIRGEIDEGE